MEENKKYQKAYELIKNADNILIATHDRPDGDALASTCAIIELAESLNKNFFAYCLNTPPTQFNFLPHVEKIKSEIREFDFFNYDLIITLDCGSLNRTNLAKEIINKKEGQIVIEFDHHPKIDNYADIEIKRPELSSTTEVLYYLFKYNRIKFTKNIANCILTGIATDTAYFIYPVTTEKTIDIASEMLLYGAKFPSILEHTWRNKSLEAMRIWGSAMNNLKINKKYNFAFSVLSNKNLSENKVSEEELEGVAGFLSNLYGVKGLLLLREEKKGLIKGSLRTSHPKINIAILAQILGGGGHPKASGFYAEGELKKTDGFWQIA